MRWAILEDCLCVFANGDGGLTLLFPPLGPGDPLAALRRCLEICDDYNAANRFEGWTRVEYVSREMLGRFTSGPAGRLDLDVRPMSGDYVYLTQRMIDLGGGDLSSKRQARNRFARRYEARTEPYAPRHAEECLWLLARWNQSRAVPEGANEGPSPAAPAPRPAPAHVEIKRSKDVSAAREAMAHCEALGLKGLVLYAGPKIVGFTLGEMLDERTCSILIEKTDREFAGSAQYIFSEFCRQCWSHTQWCNVGDDWDVPSLAWTKESYRPARRLEKFILRPARVAKAATSPARREAMAEESGSQFAERIRVHAGV